MRNLQIPDMGPKNLPSPSSSPVIPPLDSAKTTAPPSAQSQDPERLIQACGHPAPKGTTTSQLRRLQCIVCCMQAGISDKYREWKHPDPKSDSDDDDEDDHMQRKAYYESRAALFHYLDENQEHDHPVWFEHSAELAEEGAGCVQKASAHHAGLLEDGGEERESNNATQKGPEPSTINTNTNPGLHSILKPPNTTTIAGTTSSTSLPTRKVSLAPSALIFGSTNSTVHEHRNEPQDWMNILYRKGASYETGGTWAPPKGGWLNTSGETVSDMKWYLPETRERRDRASEAKGKRN